ncbi:hypothetical protein SAMN02910291_01387 [Desulfovibrio desulfuricans]|uniref:Uncharacterized protein n=1 Tax=Desulfovibrio desulfuricans TaxID=876 RepID=A0AA94L258_DESDE|nr:hypothetical protein SAMN02910291_01387 [Desulfovibrio desulfuricans]
MLPRHTPSIGARQLTRQGRQTATPGRLGKRPQSPACFAHLPRLAVMLQSRCQSRTKVSSTPQSAYLSLNKGLDALTLHKNAAQRNTAEILPQNCIFRQNDTFEL